MTATNHALTGAAIGLLVGEPIIAIPAAVASHFICDALPHYDAKVPGTGRIKSNTFRNYLIVEAAICFLIVLTLFILQPQNWLLASVCAFAAAAPDFGWINKFVKARKGEKHTPNAFSRFAENIQWFHKPIGGWVEAAWALAAIVIILPFLR